MALAQIWPRIPAPRTRGDGPPIPLRPSDHLTCSPHPRGWSRIGYSTGTRSVLLPAPAGMVPPRPAADSSPRHCSPHPRGWSRVGHDPPEVTVLLPAPAGMVPPAATPTASRSSAPRTRGDGPADWNAGLAANFCSPHPRGWSLIGLTDDGRHELLPAPAGMVPRAPSASGRCSSAPRTRGDGPSAVSISGLTRTCSPHPRGWSLCCFFPKATGFLLPAPAGMVPRRPACDSWPRTAPRTRGDGPARSERSATLRCCSPHPRGWSPRGSSPSSAAGSAPRTRGDGPNARHPVDAWASCSPHPRGWSPARPRTRPKATLLPAPAGMVPACPGSWFPLSAAPRTRGDGPSRSDAQDQALTCSPHPRGWSRLLAVLGQAQFLLPAPAGMVPGRRTRPKPVPTAPRTRGDGPIGEGYAREIFGCSPHPRGWSPDRTLRVKIIDLLPAPAGMVPCAPCTTRPRPAAPRTRGDGPVA